MEKVTYKIKNGEISFDNQNIVIVDNSKKQLRILILYSILWIIYGIISILRYNKTGDQFLLWAGIFITVAHLVVIIMTLFRSSKKEIKKEEIISIDLKQRLGNKFMDIKLNGNKIRRVNQIDNIYDELKQYIELNFNEK